MIITIYISSKKESLKHYNLKLMYNKNGGRLIFFHCLGRQLLYQQ